jgi:hypothetical protein
MVFTFYVFSLRRLGGRRDLWLGRHSGRDERQRDGERPRLRDVLEVGTPGREGGTTNLDMEVGILCSITGAARARRLVICHLRPPLSSDRSRSSIFTSFHLTPSRTLAIFHLTTVTLLRLKDAITRTSKPEVAKSWHLRESSSSISKEPGPTARPLSWVN